MLIKSGKPFPTVTVVHPPVQPFKIPQTHSTLTNWSKSSPLLLSELPLISMFNSTGFDNSRQISIAICGRFFRGRQSKGHDTALSLFTDLNVSRRFVIFDFTCFIFSIIPLSFAALKIVFNTFTSPNSAFGFTI